MSISTPVTDALPKHQSERKNEASTVAKYVTSCVDVAAINLKRASLK